MIVIVVVVVVDTVMQVIRLPFGEELEPPTPKWMVPAPRASSIIIIGSRLEVVREIE